MMIDAVTCIIFIVGLLISFICGMFVTVYIYSKFEENKVTNSKKFQQPRSNDDVEINLYKALNEFRNKKYGNLIRPVVKPELHLQREFNKK